MDNDADKPAFDASFGIQLVKKYNAAKQSKNDDHSRIVEFLMLSSNKVTTVVFVFFMFFGGSSFRSSSFMTAKILFAFCNAF